MEYVNTEALFRPRCPEDDFDLAGVGKVRIRGLTRAEIKEVSDGVDGGKDMEAVSLSLAFVNPRLTVEQAETYLRTAGFEEANNLSRRINELSGIAGKSGGDQPTKAAYKSTRSKPRS